MKERIDRLSRITDGLNIIKDYPMLKVIDCFGISELDHAIKNYIWQNVYYWSAISIDVNEKDYINAHKYFIESLPNITPNGLILPKKETFLAYNEIHKAVDNMLKDVGLDEKIDKIHAPINIRLVKGIKDNSDQRPRASSKMHTDIWAGEPAGAMLCAIVVGGDWTASTVRYVEPTHMPEDMIRPLVDYNDGKHIARSGEHYDTLLDDSGLFLMDSYLLHQTMKLREGYRLSIDFRFIPKDTIESDKYNKELRTDNYMSYEDWSGYGTQRILSTQDQLEEYKGQDTTKDAYACAYNTADLIDS